MESELTRGVQVQGADGRTYILVANFAQVPVTTAISPRGAATGATDVVTGIPCPRERGRLRLSVGAGEAVLLVLCSQGVDSAAGH